MECVEASRPPQSIALLAALLAVLAATGPLAQEAPRAPTIEVTQVPPRGGGPNEMATLSGRVKGVDSPAKLRLVFFSRTDRWYVQPYTADPYTAVNPDGLADKVYNLWNRNPVTVSRTYMTSNGAKDKPTPPALKSF